MVGKTGTLGGIEVVTLLCTSNYCILSLNLQGEKTLVSIKNFLDEAVKFTHFINSQLFNTHLPIFYVIKHEVYVKHFYSIRKYLKEKYHRLRYKLDTLLFQGVLFVHESDLQTTSYSVLDILQTFSQNVGSKSDTSRETTYSIYCK